MYKKLKVLIIILLLCLFIVSNFNNEKNEKLSTNINKSFVINDSLKNYGSRNLYTIVNEDFNEYVNEYKNFFELDGDIFDYENYLEINNNSNTVKLQIDKNYNGYTYSNSNLESTKIIQIEDIKNIVDEFIKKNNLSINYEQIEISKKDDLYKVKLINRIDNLKNYSFVNSFLFDENGNVLFFEYFNVSYLKIGDIKILNEKKAFEKLISNYNYDEPISIDKINLVYYYEDDILKPVYLFEGNSSKNKINIFIDAIY